jgi:hypothetical protein
MLRKISCLVLLSLLVGLLFCGPALAADHSLARGAGGYFQAGRGGGDGSGSGHAMGYLSIALVSLIAAMGFINSSKRLMKKVKPKTRIWLRRVHGFLGLAVIVTIIIHIMTVSD